MKTTLITFFTLITTLSFSQTRNIKVNINSKVVNENFWMSLNSQVEDLGNCRIEFIDSAKKVVKTVTFPKGKPHQSMKQYTEISFPVLELPVGPYSYNIYLGKELMYKGNYNREPNKK